MKEDVMDAGQQVVVLDTGRMAVLDNRFEVEWATDVCDTYGTQETRHVTGSLIMTADTIYSAMEYAAEGLCDVDFFYPNQTVSASSTCVLSGSVTIGLGSDRRHGVFPDLGRAWPGLVKADFEEVEILSIRKL